MFLEWFEKIPQLMHMGWSDLAKFLLGAACVGTTALGWVRSTRKAAQAQIETEKQRLRADHEMQRADHETAISQLKSQHSDENAKMQIQVIAAQQSRAEAESEREKATTELVALRKRIADLEAFDGKQWEQDTHTTAPPFINVGDRKTRFISILNLKGGVGKTTLTANIGVSLARRNHRVLMVDLDFQGSLTRLCVSSNEQLQEIIEKRKTSARLLSEAPDSLPPGELTNHVNHPNLVGHTCHFIGAGEGLAETELRAQARWLVTKTPDVRFTFRTLFHTTEIFNHYDFVLFDCPPRLTTACVNALGCSDFVLVPVLLEQGSVDALPRTLNWLKKLSHVSRARLLGVVANRVDFHTGKPISAQQNIYTYLKQALRRLGYENGVFRAPVRNQRALIEEAANRGKIAAWDDDAAALFANVTNEVEKGVQI